MLLPAARRDASRRDTSRVGRSAADDITTARIVSSARCSIWRTRSALTPRSPATSRSDSSFCQSEAEHRRPAPIALALVELGRRTPGARPLLGVPVRGGRSRIRPRHVGSASMSPEAAPRRRTSPTGSSRARDRPGRAAIRLSMWEVLEHGSQPPSIGARSSSRLCSCQKTGSERRRQARQLVFARSESTMGPESSATICCIACRTHQLAYAQNGIPSPGHTD